MEYPYYIVPSVEEYATLDPESPEAHKLARFISVNIGDVETLRRILGERAFEDARTESLSTGDSFSTIDSFLNKFAGNSSPIGYMASVPDTLTSLLRLHRYEEAIKLIERQNLNNPQKNIYFAHQMRFIKKLQALDKFKNKNRD